MSTSDSELSPEAKEAIRQFLRSEIGHSGLNAEGELTLEAKNAIREYWRNEIGNAGLTSQGELTSEGKGKIDEYLLSKFRLWGNVFGFTNAGVILAGILYVIFIVPKQAATQAHTWLMDRWKDEDSAIQKSVRELELSIGGANKEASIAGYNVNEFRTALNGLLSLSASTEKALKSNSEEVSKRKGELNLLDDKITKLKLEMSDLTTTEPGQIAESLKALDAFKDTQGALNELKSTVDKVSVLKQEMLRLNGQVAMFEGSKENKTPGSIVAYGSLTAPIGWLICDGATLEREDERYKGLFAVIGTRYGSPDERHFNVPDFRGQFLRGCMPDLRTDCSGKLEDDSITTYKTHPFNRTGMRVRLRDIPKECKSLVMNRDYFVINLGDKRLALADVPIAAMNGKHVRIDRNVAGMVIVQAEDLEAGDRYALGPNGALGNSIGSMQDDAFQSHWHAYFPAQINFGIAGAGMAFDNLGNTSPGRFNNVFGARIRDAIPDKDNAVVRSSTETRPKNVYVNYIIKY